MTATLCSLALLAAALLEPAAPAPLSRVILHPHHLQGAGHFSPLREQRVEGVEGVVTAIRRDGFHLQTAAGEEDGLDETSEAIRVRVSGSKRPAIGDKLRLAGRVEEVRPGRRETNLPRTQLLADADWELLASDVALPPAVLLGPDGRVPPGQIIDDDTPDGQVSSATPFDPAYDGLDFWESLEGMRVELPAAVAVGPSTKHGEIPVILLPGPSGTPGLGADGRLRALEGDAQPEILILDDTLHELPSVVLGARFDGPVRGVLDHDFGAFRLLVDAEPRVRSPQRPAHPDAVRDDRLWVASYNVENLSAQSDPARFAKLAAHLVGPLGSPDVVALQEIQDDSGPSDDGRVSARLTLKTLIDAVLAAGGPSYTPVGLDPDDKQDGGQPGGNIRVAYLVRESDSLRVAERSGDATRAALEAHSDGSPRLISNPAKLEPGHSAWNRSRKPLVLELRHHGRALFLINLHLSSRSGDPSLFDAMQPPISRSSAAREMQCGVVASFVARLQAIDPEVAVIVLGDLNTFESSPELLALKDGHRLTLLTERIPLGERGTYIYQGRTQSLDHALVSPGLLSWDAEPELRHLPLNNPFPVHASDHDPLLLIFGTSETGPR